MKYAPLSIVLPAHVASLKERQAAFVEKESQMFFDSASPTLMTVASEPAPPLAIVTDVTAVFASKATPESRTSPTSTFSASPPRHSPNSRPRASFGRSQSSYSASTSPRSSPGRLPPQISPPPSSTLSNDLHNAIASHLISFDARAPGFHQRPGSPNPHRMPVVKIAPWNPKLPTPSPVLALPAIVARTSETHPIK